MARAVLFAHWKVLFPLLTGHLNTEKYSRARGSRPVASTSHDKALGYNLPHPCLQGGAGLAPGPVKPRRETEHGEVKGTTCPQSQSHTPVAPWFLPQITRPLSPGPGPPPPSPLSRSGVSTDLPEQKPVD